MGSNARKFFENTFDPATHTDKNIRLYGEIYTAEAKFCLTNNGARIELKRKILERTPGLKLMLFFLLELQKK